jgi:DNA gyrase/topoisomerase IV subunit A
LRQSSASNGFAEARGPWSLAGERQLQGQYRTRQGADRRPSAAAPDPPRARDAADPDVATDHRPPCPCCGAWPSADVGPLVALVGEPARDVAEDGTYRLSDEQARAILDLRLQRLTGLERDKIAEELRRLISEIAGYLEILRSRARLIEVLRSELLAIPPGSPSTDRQLHVGRDLWLQDNPSTVRLS